MSRIKDKAEKVMRNDDITIETKPTIARIELTGKCTLECSFCVNKDLKKDNLRQNYLTDEDFDLIIDSLLDAKTITDVGMHYVGESGLHPRIAHYCKKLKEAGFNTYLTTNGTTVRNLLKAIPYIDNLEVSWNYKDSDDFENKTGRDEDVYVRIINNIHTLWNECHKRDKKLALATILEDGSQRNEYAVISLLPHDEHRFITLEEKQGKQSQLPCWSLFKGVYIDTDLNLRTCTYGHNNEHILGNLRVDTIDDILENATPIKEQQLKNEVPKICEKCFSKNTESEQKEIE